MIDRTIARAGAAAGIVYVLVLFGSGAFGESDTGHRVALVGMLFFFPFLGYLWRVLREAEGGEGWLSTTALSAGLCAVTIKIASGGHCSPPTKRPKARAFTTRSSGSTMWISC